MDTITTIQSLLKCDGSAQPVTVALMPSESRLIAAAPSMADTLLWIRENLHPKVLGRGATDAELIAISLATKVLREAGVIPTHVLTEREP